MCLGSAWVPYILIFYRLLGQCSYLRCSKPRVPQTVRAFKRRGLSGRLTGCWHNNSLRNGVFYSVETNAPFERRCRKGRLQGRLPSTFRRFTILVLHSASSPRSATSQKSDLRTEVNSRELHMIANLRIWSWGGARKPSSIAGDHV